jgi:hypothetical protein
VRSVSAALVEGARHRGWPGPGLIDVWLRPGSARQWLVRHCGVQKGKHAARGEGRACRHGIPGSVPARAASPAGGERQRVALGLVVQVGDPGLGDLVVDTGVHRGLLG